MMNLRKNPEKDLRRLSGLFFQIGLLSALLMTVSAFEWTTEDEQPVVEEPDRLMGQEDFLVPITEIEEKKPPKPKKVTLIEVKEDPPEPPMELIPDILDGPVELPEPEPLPEMKEDVPEGPVDYTDEMPTPVGGYDAFYKYVGSHLNYTRKAQRLNLEGRVFIQFIVDTNGNLTNVKVVRGLGAGLDEEAVKVMENAAPWNPGRQSGRRVKVRMIIPIHFKLQ